MAEYVRKPTPYFELGSHTMANSLCPTMARLSLLVELVKLDSTSPA